MAQWPPLNTLLLDAPDLDHGKIMQIEMRLNLICCDCIFAYHTFIIICQYGTLLNLYPFTQGGYEQRWAFIEIIYRR